MNTDSSHIEKEKFDTLRAGLRADDVDFKDACTPRLMDRQNAYWQRIVDTLEQGVDQDRITCNKLRILRRKVLNGECREPARGWGFPRMTAGAAAGVALLAGAAVWWDSQPTEPNTATVTASLERSEIDANLEIANNIDFYTWLENQTDTVADSGGN